LWHEQIEQRVKENKYLIETLDKRYLINLKPFSPDDSKHFILHRLEAKEFKLTTDYPMPQPEFTEELIELIWKKSKDNPRAMLRIANAIIINYL
jgi:hypothetical protein